MATLPSFEELLPAQTDPIKSAIRRRLLLILNSQGEILPSANSPRGKLWHLVNAPKSSLTDCAEVIETDPALAARIFRVANSGAYAVGADSVSEAILHLGMKFVREQVFNSGVFKQYSGWVLPPEWDQFWLRNIFVARMTERIAAAYGSTNGTEYLAGLIHDIGWLFLATNFPDEFANLFASGKPIAEAEQDILPFSHAEISAAIAARSLLPARAISAVRDHHHPLTPTPAEPGAAVEPDLLTFVLKVADDIADSYGITMFGQPGWSIEQIDQGPEMLWLSQKGKAPDLAKISEEELSKSKEIFEAYFSNRKFE